MALAAINVESPACRARSKTTIGRRPQWSKLFLIVTLCYIIRIQKLMNIVLLNFGAGGYLRKNPPVPIYHRSVSVAVYLDHWGSYLELCHVLLFIELIIFAYLFAEFRFHLKCLPAKCASVRGCVRQFVQ